MAVSQQASIIGAYPFFRKLPASYLERLSAVARHVSFPAGYRLFDEGGTAHRFWLLDAGQVALDAMVPGDGTVTIETLGRGDIVGLSWLQQPCQYRYGAVATQPMQAYEFDAAAVLAACEQDPVFGYQVTRRFLAVAADRLQATRARLLQARRAAA